MISPNTSPTHSPCMPLHMQMAQTSLWLMFAYTLRFHRKNNGFHKIRLFTTAISSQAESQSSINPSSNPIRQHWKQLYYRVLCETTVSVKWTLRGSHTCEGIIKIKERRKLPFSSLVQKYWVMQFYYLAVVGELESSSWRVLGLSSSQNHQNGTHDHCPSHSSERLQTS